ncbi:hypothetical protein T484DRAFT_2971343 [Baffinella frigidus]|nr:hypothetical protein T484DRAFT_2971343 [Cryptophyta sp. CCMP2293]
MKHETRNTTPSQSVSASRFTRNPKHETRNPEPGTRNPEHKTRNPKTPKPEIPNPKPQTPGGLRRTRGIPSAPLAKSRRRNLNDPLPENPAQNHATTARAQASLPRERACPGRGPHLCLPSGWGRRLHGSDRIRISLSKVPPPRVSQLFFLRCLLLPWDGVRCRCSGPRPCCFPVSVYGA